MEFPFYISTLNELPEKSLQPLLNESLTQGFNFIFRLIEDYKNQTNRFSKPGEILLGIYHGINLVAIGGLNIDPYLPNISAGRVRHVYVLNKYRRKGVGKILIHELIKHSESKFKILTLRTKTEAGAKFYQSLGFSPSDSIPNTTHVLSIKS